jgi:hypothetical protein
MKSRLLWVTLMLAGMFVTAIPVQASVAGRKNTAIGATGLAIYELARGHTTTGLLAGAGAYYAWHRYNQAHKRSNRQHAYMAGYQAGVRRAYGTTHTASYSRRHHRRRR